MLWEKEKLLVTSNFSFSHSVLKRLVLQTPKKPGLVWERVKPAFQDLDFDFFDYRMSYLDSVIDLDLSCRHVKTGLVWERVKKQ